MLNRAADLISLLRSLGQESVLVGGLAVSMRARERFTRDVDVCVDVASDVEAEALVMALQGEGARLVSVVEQDAVGRLAMARFAMAGQAFEHADSDIIFASSGIESEILEDAEQLVVASGIVLPVARVPHLIAMKMLSADADRPQDAEDLWCLLAAASGDDRARVRELLELILARGFARGRDLLRLWEATLSGE